MKGSLNKGTVFLIVIMAITFTIFAAETEIDTYKVNGHRNEQWDELVFKGFREYAEDNFPDALMYLKQAYELGCRDGLVLFRIASCYAQDKMCNEAVHYAEESIPKLKENYSNHYYNHVVYQILGDCTVDNEKAIDYYLKGLEFDPSDVSIRLNMSFKLIRLNRLDEAERHIHIVLGEYSGTTSSYGYGVAYHGLGSIYKKRGQHREAADAFRKALDYRNESSDAWWAARSYEMAGDYEQAAKYWKLAASLYGEDTEWGRKALKNLNKLKTGK